MKKEMRIRVKNLHNNNKSENQTKPSIKKHRRKISKQIVLLKPSSNEIIESQTESNMEQTITKVQLQSCETTPNIPCNINIDDYIHDIDNHITQIDKSFYKSLSTKLRAAGNIQITSDMRKILIKWLIRVGGKFRVRSQTMHMCVQLIDYMLIHKGQMFNKANFQLLGVTCLFISCKYNEIYTIQSQKYCQICDGIYTISQLFQMQSIVLMELNFNLQIPTVYQFINKLVYDFKIASQHFTLIKSLADLFIFDFNSFNNYTKLQLSIVIVYFTSKIYKLEQLKNSLSYYKNKIQPQTFKSCFIAVVALFKKSHLHNPNISI